MNKKLVNSTDDLIGLVLFVMSHLFQHLTGVEPCVKQTIHLNTPLFTGQILKLIQDDRKKLAHNHKFLTIICIKPQKTHQISSKFTPKIAELDYIFFNSKGV